MSRREREVQWQPAVAPKGSQAWEADVEGARWRACMHPPDGVSLYSLHVGGRLVERFNRWPSCWSSNEDEHQRGAYELDWEHDQRRTASGRLHLALVALRAGAQADEAQALDAIADEVERAAAVAAFRDVAVDPKPRRQAEFDGGTPVRPEGPMYPQLAAATQAARRASQPRQRYLLDLLDGLDALVRGLVYAADCAEFTDALNNSRQYLWAAGHVDLAAQRTFEWLGAQSATTTG